MAVYASISQRTLLLRLHFGGGACEQSYFRLYHGACLSLASQPTLFFRRLKLICRQRSQETTVLAHINVLAVDMTHAHRRAMQNRMMQMT